MDKCFNDAVADEGLNTCHRDQEEVRRGDFLQVIWISVSEPFYVDQSQHHGTRRDASLPEPEIIIVFVVLKSVLNTSARAVYNASFECTKA